MTDPVGSDAAGAALAELERWRRSTIPESSTPLDAEDLVRLVRDCFSALGLAASIVREVTVNTVHYYRRKDIIDPPVGKTVAARYDRRHLWQIAGARLAGHLGLVALAEARDAIRGADESASMAFLAARIADARGRDTVRGINGPDGTREPARPLPGVAGVSSRATSPATIVTLPGNAWCVIPAKHAAHHSEEAAAALARALVVALRSTTST
jgi:hypothetical protein